jgi:ABC-2 type transport system permease protein
MTTTTSSTHVHEAPGIVPATIGAARAIAWRHLYKWIKIPSNYLPTVLFPLVFFLGFSGSLGAIQKGAAFHYGPGYPGFIFVFSLLQTCMFGGMATGFTIAADFESGFAQRLMLCTQSRHAILLGYIGSTFVRAAIMCCVVTVVALIVGLHVQGSVGELAAVYGIALLMSFVGSMWSSGVMFRGRSASAAPAMQTPMFIMIFLAPVFVPFDLLTGWLHHVARYNPITWVMEGERSLLAGDPQRIGALGCAGGMLTLFLLWAVSGVHSAERAGGK